jgi:hypothetical protein
MKYDNPHWYYLDFFMHFGKNYSDGMINVIFDEKQKTGIKGFWI